MLEIAQKIAQKKEEFLNIIKDANSINKVQEINSKYLKNGVKELYALLKEVAPENKKEAGKLINDFKCFLTSSIEDLKSKNCVTNETLKYDHTIVKHNIQLGASHPLIKLYKKMERLFLNMGFSVVQGPEVELDKNNFEKLNMPAHHPARDMQDTFYISSPTTLLRSHTSCVQIRSMEKSKPPIQIISPGTVYRVDDIDPQHTPMFYQVEGLMIGEDISFANLKMILTTLLKEVFGEEIKVRFRPSYYPYTEPSAAIDMSCTECGQKGCRTCNNSGWITVLGAGMVHPNVLEGVGYDSEKYTGFAFGLGLNRLALLYYGLGEIRKIYENDISLWSQL